jgi:hypothetical protein
LALAAGVKSRQKASKAARREPAYLLVHGDPLGTPKERRRSAMSYPEPTEGGLWQDSSGNVFGTTDGAPPTNVGTSVTVYDTNGNPQPGVWIGDTAVPFNNGD